MRLREEHLGRTARCPYCRQPVVLSGVAEVPADTLLPAPEPPMVLTDTHHGTPMVVAPVDAVATALRQAIEPLVQQLAAAADQPSAQQFSQAIRPLVETLKQHGQDLSDQVKRQHEQLLEALGRGQQELAQQIATAVEAHQQRRGTEAAQLLGACAHIEQALAAQSAALGQSLETMSRRLSQHWTAVGAELLRHSTLTQQRSTDLAHDQTALLEQFNQQLVQVQSQYEQSARQHLERLSVGAQVIVESVGDQLGQQLSNHMQQAGQAAAQSLADVMVVGKELAEVLASGQRRLSEQISVLTELLQGHNRLEQMQQALTWNLEMVSRADDFKQVLKNLDQGLYAMRAAAERVRVQAAAAAPLADPVAPAPRRPGLLRRCLRALGIGRRRKA
jgi:hypothetical protein